jgi:CRP-like cAMP-binding protein
MRPRPPSNALGAAVRSVPLHSSSGGVLFHRLPRGPTRVSLGEQSAFCRAGTDGSPLGFNLMDVEATSNALIRKLSVATNLQHADVERLRLLCAETIDVGPGRDLIVEGDPVGSVHLILDRMAFRIATLDRSVNVRVPNETIDPRVEEYPRLTPALWWCSLVNEATSREWLVNVGRRPVAKRMAHFFCEKHIRRSEVGLAKTGSFRLPLPQAHLSDILGTSSVHTHRTLQQLRRRRLIAFERSVMTISDPEILEAFVDYDPNYLHLQTLSSAILRRNTRICAQLLDEEFRRLPSIRLLGKSRPAVPPGAGGTQIAIEIETEPMAALIFHSRVFQKEVQS